MDAPSTNPINPAALPRQRSSPANDHAQSPPPMAQQQPYPYPVQQQQPAWQPSQPQFYPQFYQNPHQQPYPIHPHQAHPQQGQMQYYDPANAQLAQWAYQQMMFQQAHQMSQMSPMPAQRARSGSTGSPDYFAQGQMANFSPFPSGTPPPPHPSHLPMGYQPQPDQNGQHGGYHPYRRPQRQGSSNQDADWRSPPQPSGSFKPPYAQVDAAGSSTSVNSGSSHSGSHRQRANSNQGSGHNSPAPTPAAHVHPKQSSSRSTTSNPAPPPSSNGSSQRVHQRTGSSSSNASSARSQPPAAAAATISPPPTQINLRKPSPLSQGTFTAAEKRMSRDDSDLAAMMEPTAVGPRSGLKGRLRRALSLNANNTLHEEDEENATSRHGAPRPSTSSGATLPMDDGDSTATVQKKKSRSLFNNKFNRSTDNISLSSTMSSASMVIRKLGSIGKLARRNSLAGITSLFKDKNKDGDEEGSGKKSKKKKGEKGAAAEASVSHVTAELDRSDWTASPDMVGLSPAARLARQHTLKTNAEAAAKAKAEAERVAAETAGGPVPTTWEKNTTNRQNDNLPGRVGGPSRVNEDGMRVVVEHDDSDSGSDEQDHAHNYSHVEGWEDDEEWGEGHDDEDMTIRQALDGASLEEDDPEMEPWALNLRRSVERTRKPAKGILKKPVDGSEYTQDTYLPPNPAFTRARANSYDSAQPSGEASHPSHLPGSDPDQIDGLAKSHGSANGHSPAEPGPFLPQLSFDSNGINLDSPVKHEVAEPAPIVATEKTSLFSLPNSSAPALSKFSSSTAPTLTHRSATAPAKRLVFAANLSVYDTFPATVYDRRSEPATWSRLTPALAQRIKEELNSYKMEEMEVHANSRVQCVVPFFLSPRRF
ncbi:uncharacterized protein BXZ73DRAFT_89104 [Epithele typhae]|uniref:uncharacterized protein n=1 Tax=Epithele typhae TaxID=378194 RepID=UPI00200828BC|nr:uncharacterized protein BXZ73DRAFT_89104 [Epithele typhae]KAH9939020.1 hypothetical protein BXZ73DRAFT_89104 [Epithele typhae]